MARLYNSQEGTPGVVRRLGGHRYYRAFGSRHGTRRPLASADASGRRYELFFSPESEEGFVGQLAADASELCPSPIAVTTVTRRSFFLKLDRRLRKAKLVLRYTATGIGSGGPGRARYRITLRGPWTPF